MKRIFLILLLAISSTYVAGAQCGVTALTSKVNLLCGDSITLTAVAHGLTPVLQDFNGNTLGNFTATSDAVVTDGSGTYSCMGPSLDHSPYVFMGSGINTPRYLVSNTSNLAAGSAFASLCFQMKYNTQGQSGVCEGPDAVGEGVYLQYSTDGTSWTELKYWDPNGGNDPQLISWNTYCIDLPAAALTTTTSFRWIQLKCSGIGYDTWAIDNVKVTVGVVGYTFDWLHDNLPANTSPYTPNVAPSQTTSYTVTYSNKGSGGTDTCSSTVTVNVIKAQVTAPSVPPICDSSSVRLQALTPYSTVAPVSCGFSTKKTCDPVSEESNDFKIGNGTIVNNYNSATNNLFGDFGPTNYNSRMQILYKASELKAAGMKAGRISSLTFDLAKLEDKGAYIDFSIYMGCTTLSAFTGTASSFVPYAALNLVYGGTGKHLSPDSILSMNSGLLLFNLDYPFNWDGSSNIVIQVCWTVANNQTLLAAKTRDHNSGFNSTIQGVNNTFDYTPDICETGSTFTQLSNTRPNIIFGNCYSRNIAMVYSWTPSSGLSDSTAANPLALPSVTTTYTVTSYRQGSPACSSTASVVVKVIKGTNNKPIITQHGDTLISSSENGNLWYLNGDSIVIDTLPRHHITKPGCYKVRVTYPGGCQYFSDTMCVSIVITQIGRNTAPLGISIVPNPFRESTTIRINDSSLQDGLFRMYDLYGREVRTVELRHGSAFEIRKNELGEGIYFYTITGTAAGRVTGKLVIQ